MIVGSGKNMTNPFESNIIKSKVTNANDSQSVNTHANSDNTKSIYTEKWAIISFVVVIILILLLLGLSTLAGNSKHTVSSVWAEGRQSYLAYIDKNDKTEDRKVICQNLMKKHFGLFSGKSASLKDTFLSGCHYEKRSDYISPNVNEKDDIEDKEFKLVFPGDPSYEPHEPTDSISSNEIYSAGYKLGFELATRHTYYKGSSYISQECKGFVEDYIGGSSNSTKGSMFIRGCVNGYKEAFGKR